MRAQLSSYKALDPKGGHILLPSGDQEAPKTHTRHILHNPYIPHITPMYPTPRLYTLTPKTLNPKTLNPKP